MRKKWKFLNGQDFLNPYFVFVKIKHDDNSCFALIEYERNARNFDKLYPPAHPVHIPKGYTMHAYAMRYNTTIKKMKEHWRCADFVLGKDPTDLYFKK